MRDFDLHFYGDIINLPHHISTVHKQMKMSDRAAQFGSFDALTGHDDAIAETGRLTAKKHEITEHVMEILNARLQIVEKSIESQPEITITYFKADFLKDVGAYVKYTGNLRKIDYVEKTLIFSDETVIQINMIYNIESQNFVWNDENFYF